LTSVCRRQRFLCVCGRAAVVAEEKAGSSGVDDGKGDRQGLREFWDEKRNDTGEILFIDSKISAMILKSEPKRF
jgi:hypothetical protein